MTKQAVSGCALLALTAALTLSSCHTAGPETSPSSTTPASTPADYPIVWIPTPHLDLDSPDGTFVRAITESVYRSLWLNWTGTAPGFRDAHRPMLDPQESKGVMYYTRRAERPHTTYMWAAPFVTTSAPHKYDWTPLSRTIGGVAVCFDTPVRSTNPPAFMFFTYRRAGTVPPANQRGMNPMPSGNVFGDWHALDWIDSTNRRAERCDRRPLGLPPPTYQLRPSSPGWPANSQ